MLRVMIEPWAYSYDVPPGAQVDVVAQLRDGEIDFEINFESDNFIGIWAPEDTKMMIEGVAMDVVSDN